MSKKKAFDYKLLPLHKNKPYMVFEFLDKKGRTMRSSVDVLINWTYFTDGADDWDYQKLNGYVLTR